MKNVLMTSGFFLFGPSGYGVNAFISIPLKSHRGRLPRLTRDFSAEKSLGSFEPLTFRPSATQPKNLGMFVSLTLKSKSSAGVESDFANDDSEPEDDIKSPPLPGQMKISEIKSELALRGVSFDDCFDRESLEMRLNDARSSGKADPRLIDEFNRRNLEANVQGAKFEVSDQMIENSVGGDGNLPGGMPPEMLKEMMADEEIVTMLRSVKMQEVMKLVMTGGQEALEEAMKNDEETYECVQKLNQIFGKMNRE